MRTRVKICGITRLEDAEAAVALGADALGFVLWPKSPRAVQATQAAAIARAVPSLVTRVGVFVNPAMDEVIRAVAAIGLDVVQLHGDEAIAAFAGVPARLMKAVTLASPADVAQAAAAPAGITLLVDALDRDRRGGTGQRADWTEAAALARARPIVLAGGLTAANVGEAIQTVRPWAIDVSSGVEERPGVKSIEKLRALFAAVREELA